MQILRGLWNRPYGTPDGVRGCALTIGNFDGVHRGHQAMLALLRNEARHRGVPSCVMTFEPHPRDFFAAAARKPELAPARIATLRPTDSFRAVQLTTALEGRRERRNEFFHSAKLLDLTLHASDCVLALTDLLDYGVLLFPPDPERPGEDWAAYMEATANMATAEALLRLNRRCFAEPALGPRVTAILARQPRIGQRPSRRGCAVAHHPDDHHLRLAIRDGGRDLRDRLRVLLADI